MIGLNPCYYMIFANFNSEFIHGFSQIAVSLMPKLQTLGDPITNKLIFVDNTNEVSNSKVI